MILEKALTLDLRHFEDSEFYDKLTRARREASSRPLSLVMRTSGLFQNALAIASFAVLLANFSPWAVLILLFGGLPAFFAETKFSGDAFRLFRWRAPETRMQSYLETALAREGDTAVCPGDEHQDHRFGQHPQQHRHDVDIRTGRMRPRGVDHTVDDARAHPGHARRQHTGEDCAEAEEKCE
jgi:hypothetical protein